MSRSRSTGDPRALVGKVLSGRWRVDRLVGAGGMASVYAATHRNGRRVAIKLLKPELAANARVRRRFLREGYLANRVGHPGAVAVLDDDQTDDGVFLVMELLEGSSLESLCTERGGKLPVGDVCWAASRALEVLAAAHGRGVVHRDVKPSNLFFTAEGSLKLLDFGIASLREIADFSTLTQAGAALGTPGYMAPEQARGKWKELSVATDLWGVGATMFRLLSGRLVHHEETASETIIAAATTPPPRLAEAFPEAPAEVAAIVDRALRVAPAARWPDALTMARALSDLASALNAPSVLCPRAEAAMLTADEGAPLDSFEAAGSLDAALATAAGGSPRPAPRRMMLLGLGLLAGGGAVFGIGRWSASKSSSATSEAASAAPTPVVPAAPAPSPLASASAAPDSSVDVSGTTRADSQPQQQTTPAVRPGGAGPTSAQTRGAAKRPASPPQSGAPRPWHNELLEERK